MDKRFIAVRDRLRQLNLGELIRIREAIALDRVCYDTFNYDSTTGKYCPLAIAKGFHLDGTIQTDEMVRLRLSAHFSPVNVLKGVPGHFYTEDRQGDLHFLVYDVIHEKRQEETIRKLTLQLANVRDIVNS